MAGFIRTLTLTAAPFWPSLLLSMQAFGRITDPENLHQVLEVAGPDAAAEASQNLGVLRWYNPANPTGAYTLVLSQIEHRTVANRYECGMKVSVADIEDDDDSDLLSVLRITFRS